VIRGRDRSGLPTQDRGEIDPLAVSDHHGVSRNRDRARGVGLAVILRLVLAAAVGLALSASNAGADEQVHRVGVLMATEIPERTQALQEGLGERGYVVGRNLQVEYRYSQGRNEQIPALVAELVAFGSEVIVANGTPNAVAVHAGAPTIPLVFVVWATRSRSASSRAWRIRVAM
jgi:ABC-type uncharacterized transport system substrate-binding protein